jgi:glycine/D-amino acid oxidase-like deaminating enzyme
MNGTADVAVIGGGIVGLATAYFLSEAGVRDVVVLEQATVGAGASGRAAGVMLVQAGSEADLRFQLEAITVHRRLQADVGTDLHASGSLLLWRSAGAADAARARVGFHADQGIEMASLGPDDLRRDFPYLAVDDVVLGTHTTVDQWATPLATVERLANAVRGRGVVIREGCRVVDVETDGNRVQRVVTQDGGVAAGTVVNAAGAWARDLGELNGMQLPVSPRKRQVFVLEPPRDVPADSAFIMEEEDDFYCKTRAEGLIMVCGQPPGETLDASVEWGYLDDALSRTERRIPAARSMPIVGAWAGIRPVSPDGRPFLGPAPDLEGYYVAGGFGGQGFTQGPLGGRLIAELITTGRPSVDLTPYRADRAARVSRAR